MKTRILIVTFLLIALSAPTSADNIYSLIVKGRLAEAADSLSDVSTASTRDGNKLYYLSMIESDAERSAQLMEAALNASVAAVYRQAIYYRLAQYYLLKPDYNRVSRLVNEYLMFWEAGKYRGEMLRLSVLLDERQKEFDTALRQIDRYLLEYNRGDVGQWGLVDKARVMKSFNKNIGSNKQLKKLSRESSGPGVPQSLYMLAEDAIDRKRLDDAIFYFNLLREAYPTAVGLDPLMERMEGVSASYQSDNTAEKRTGTFYSIQVGVFSVKANAGKQADKFKQYDKKVDIKSKKISGKTYRVVYVGRFSDYASASAFKDKLERNHNEVFQVVAR